VLGAGATGHAISADLALAGFEISLYEEPEFQKNLEGVLERGGIEIIGATSKGFAKIRKVTTDIDEALESAEIILVAVVATRHEKMAELCAPYLKDGQTIVIGPDNGGSLVFTNIFKKEGLKVDVNIAGIGMAYYPCRLTGPAKVLVALPRSARRIAALPAKNTDKVINKLNKLKGIHDFVPGTNVLEMALSSPNTVIHLPGSVLNTGAIEQAGGSYYLYRQGITPSILRCVDAVDRERMALFKALGYTVTSPSVLLEKVAKHPEYPELEMFRGLIGPTSMQHRYIMEDAYTSTALMVSLGEMIDVPVPVTKCFLTLASLINQTDYLREGRTVEKLGLSGLSVEELNRFLYEG
jgi:opine dehydrogenase